MKGSDNLQRADITEKIGKLNIKIAKANKELEELELIQILIMNIIHKKKVIIIRKIHIKVIWKKIYCLIMTRKEKCV